jgi:hypothetical protein
MHLLFIRSSPIYLHKFPKIVIKYITLPTYYIMLKIIKLNIDFQQLIYYSTFNVFYKRHFTVIYYISQFICCPLNIYYANLATTRA